jgi:SsrA-binding protein
MFKHINIQNKKAKFEYNLLDKYVAGIVLTGTEIKSIRSSKASLSNSFCEFNDKNELFVVNMLIEEYKNESNYNHKPKQSRKLLLNKNELNKLFKEVKNSGLTIIPIRLFINEKGLAKIQISLAKGKKLFDKTEIIKERDTNRNIDRIKKSFNK